MTMTYDRLLAEALNNVVKHAAAIEATVRLCCQPGRIELFVRDDSLGFDPTSLPPDSLGLGIMRERAEAIGAVSELESGAGHGIRVQVAWTACGAG